ncbi:HEPN domain-containing protein [Saccharomonospora amisosensis]|uniref:HEPN domain-containing protein n=1 Tax=Saccharomonospora amisosensis TaxID=1128677 RepID=A0A7X5US46_9PSEU|nr:hypothetical protein [Saccharomonospora amisosensis]NIJ13204.1 HEPN domain-containing protein [Saccharomonospora amisosensis]
MPEGFSVDPHWVSGYGILLDEEHGNIDDIRWYAELYAFPHSAAYTGLMQSLATPVAAYANSLVDRLTTRSWTIEKTATELQRAAWAYLDKEEEHTQQLSGQLQVDRDSNAESYPASGPDLPEIEIPEQDYSLAFEELSWLVAGVDWFLSEQLGWSVYQDVITELLGNWKALDAEGDALINIGDATDVVASSIKDGWSTLDEYWDGGAAQACGSYVGALTEALGMEGPLNRTVGDLYKLIAAEVENTMLEIARALKLPTKDIAIELDAYGQCQVAEATEDALHRAKELLTAAKHLYEYAQNLINAINLVVERATEFLESVRSVEGVSALDEDAVRNLSQLSGHLSKEQADQLDETVADLTDLVELAQTDNWSEAPDDAFSVGDDPERAGA